MLGRNVLLRLFGVLLGAALALSLTVTPASAGQFNFRVLEPSTLFFQAGIGDQRTDAYMAGVTWDGNWRKQFSLFTASGYFEVAGGRWTTRDAGISSASWATQVGLTPVIRLQPLGHERS
jgi:hypothetical protein